MKDVHPPSRGVLTMAVGVMFLLGGLIVPSVGATADPNDESSVQDGESALSEDALLYSRDYDVTVPEAIRRLEVQSKADAVFARLQDLGPDRFAGAWIEHVPAFQAVAAFTGTSDGLGAALQLAEASGLSIDIRTGREYSLRQLDDAMLRLLPVLRDKYPDAASEIDVKSQVLRVFSSAAIQTKTIASMETEVGIPIVVEVMNEELPLHTYGGKKLTVGGEEECTSGFVVLHESGDEGVITAGHCTNAVVYWQTNSLSYSLTFKGQFNDSSHDGQWHMSGHEAFDDFWDGDSLRDVNGQVGRAGALGDFVCHYGEGSNPFGTPHGKSCGTVQSVSHTPGHICGDSQSGFCDAVWIRVTGPNLACWQADSGGPLFTAGLAYGILFSGDTSGPLPGQCATATFMSRDFFGDMNLAIQQ